MVGLAIAIEYKLIMALHLLSLGSMYLLNLIGAFYFKIRVKHDDPAFKYWADEN